MKNLGFLIGLLILGGIFFLKEEKILPPNFLTAKFGYKVSSIIVLTCSIFMLVFALFIIFRFGFTIG